MLKTKYITIDNLNDYAGVNLIEELGSKEKASAFLNRLEIRMNSFLNARLFQNVDFLYGKFTNFQKQEYKYALMEQALYILKNGDISLDSGYSEDSVKVRQGDLINLTICRNAKEHLMNCGIWTYKIHNYGASFEDWLW